MRSSWINVRPESKGSVPVRGRKGDTDADTPGGGGRDRPHAEDCLPRPAGRRPGLGLPWDNELLV